MEKVEISRANGDHVNLTLPDGTTITAALSVVYRSPVLAGALQADAEDSPSSLAVPVGYLSAWFNYASSAQAHDEPATTQDLIVYLKAADFFADEKAAGKLIKQVGIRLFEACTAESRRGSRPVTTATAHATSWSSASEHASLENGNVEVCSEQVLEQLPDHLLISVFQASGLSLHESLTWLPTAHHHSALCAHFPGITHDKALRLTESVGNAQCVTGVPPGRHGDPGSAYLPPLFEALGNMHDLRELHICAKHFISLPQVSFISFQRALMNLRQLTRLQLEGRLVALAFGGITAALPSFPKLQSISLHILRSSGLAMLGSPNPFRLRLGALLKSLKLCTSLQCISLRGLNIGTDVPAREWAGCMSMVSSLSRLTSLTLADNCINAQQLCSVVQELPFVNEGSSSSSGAITSISDLTHLCELHISGNGMSGRQGACHLITLLQALPTLQHLDLAGSSLMSAGAKELAPVFSCLTCLSHIDISGNLVGPAVKELTEAWASLGGLRFLSMASSRNPTSTSAALGDVIAQFTALTHLNLKGCALGNAIELADSLRAIRGLQSLRLDVTSHVVDALAVLAPSIASQTGMRVLELNDVKSRPADGMTRVMHCISSLPQLQRLELTGPGVDPAGAEALAASFCELRSLQVLQLKLMLPDPASVAVAVALSHLVALTTLSMPLCGLKSASVAALADSVACMPGLEWLSLHLNSIQDEGAEALAATLQGHPKLRYLDLSDSQITEVGAKAMVSAADEQGIVETCLLQGNGLQRAQLPKLQRRFSVVVGCSLVQMV